MIELTKDNLEEEIGKSGNVIVQYGATWCGNCRMIKPKVKKLSEDYKNISFVYVDAEKFPISRRLANVSDLPTFALFKDGKLAKEFQGTKIELVKELIDETSRY